MEAKIKKKEIPVYLSTAANIVLWYFVLGKKLKRRFGTSKYKEGLRENYDVLQIFSKNASYDYYFE